MAITKVIENSGNLTTASGNGRITIDQTTGKIIVRDGIAKIVEIDSSGFKYYDQAGTERIGFGVSEDGKQQIIVYDESGTPQILIGQDPKDGSPVIANSTPGRNVISDLKAD